jgi:hypothetical protein
MKRNVLCSPTPTALSADSTSPRKPTEVLGDEQVQGDLSGDSRLVSPVRPIHISLSTEFLREVKDTADKYDGCYNCDKRTGRACPRCPKGIKGDEACEQHGLMTPFQYGREAEKAFSESLRGEKHSI